MSRRQDSSRRETTADPPARLLAWYDRHARTLPWRARLGERADPYRVWLSEIMLQQTTVVVVGPYFRAFLARWPTVQDLAAADLDDVLHAWQGLGYYARARNLHKCARVVSSELGGRFPDSEGALLRLPGIGPYTAAAIAAIAFGRRAIVLDGNVERVIARLFAVTKPLPGAKTELRRLAEGLTPDARAGDYAQAVMDLGATVCLPRKPRCLLCPWSDACRGRQAGIAESLPAKAPKAVRPKRHGIAFWTVRKDGAVLLRRRPESGLLGGMIEVPSTDWRAQPWTLDEALPTAPVAARWRPLDGVVRHGFTHFELELSLVVGEAPGRAARSGLWCPADRLSDYALPTLMKKVVRHALAKL
jgi:A/G-specific adenine glycosylase